MADENITTKLEVDVTDFKKGLSDANRYIRLANSEFENATAGMEKWSDNADGLRAKLNQLERVLEGQEAAAAVLRAEYERVVSEQGETSKSAQELAIKLNRQEAACKRTAAQINRYQGDLNKMEAETDAAGDAADDLAENLADVADDAQDADKATDGLGADLADGLGKAATAAANLAKNMAGIAGRAVVTGIKGLAAASGTLLAAFLGSAEASKEYLTATAKLDAAFASSGHSAETAAKTYEELYGVIGETDQAVEAAQQIALLAKSEEDAASWAQQGAAVVGKFGDALQPETFFESA